MRYIKWLIICNTYQSFCTEHYIKKITVNPRKKKYIVLGKKMVKSYVPDLPAMQGMTGSSTGTRYLWIKTLMVDQKPWERMA